MLIPFPDMVAGSDVSSRMSALGQQPSASSYFPRCAEGFQRRIGNQNQVRLHD